MRRNSNSVRKWGLTALLAVGLICGAAYAASDCAAVPGCGDFKVIAVVTPGLDGGVLYADEQLTEETVRFSIGGQVVVHGQICGTADLNNSHTVEMSYYQMGGDLFVDTVVTDNSLQLVICMDMGHPVERPDSVTVMGEVASICVE